jgi:hypothetical protein
METILELVRDPHPLTLENYKDRVMFTIEQIERYGLKRKVFVIGTVFRTVIKPHEYYVIDGTPLKLRLLTKVKSKTCILCGKAYIISKMGLCAYCVGDVRVITRGTDISL